MHVAYIDNTNDSVNCRRRRRPPFATSWVLVSAHLKPAHITGLAPSFHQGEEGVRPRAVEAIENALAFPGAAFTIVVARGAGLSEGKVVDCSGAMSPASRTPPLE